MFSFIRKCLFIIATGVCLLGSSCPNADEIKNVFADTVESVATTVIADFISGIFGV